MVIIQPVRYVSAPVCSQARITARRRADGRVEFALSNRDGDAPWGARLFPRARFFPATATTGRWLASSALSVELSGRGAASDRAALTALYRTTGGAAWYHSSRWSTDRPLDEWYGVTTNPEGRVTALTLDRNGLSGPIPPELGDLAALRELGLDRNDLSGPIPRGLGRLAALEVLSLAVNGLSGSIPPELGNLGGSHDRNFTAAGASASGPSRVVQR